MCSLSSGDASDSICPKGWGMVGYDGDGSWQRLIKNTYSAKEKNTKKYYIEYNNNINQSGILTQLHLSFYYSGLYFHISGALTTRSTYADYWGKNKYNSEQSRRLGFGSNDIYIRDNDSYYSKYAGLSLRCVAKSFAFPL